MSRLPARPGVPLAIPLSAYDTERYGESWTYGLWAHGIRPSDSFYFAFNWGNFAGFWSCYYAARRMGCRVISGGGADSQGHIKNILRLKPTVLISTPTFALRIAAVATEMGVDLRSSSIRFTYHAGEPGPYRAAGDARQIDARGAPMAGELLGIAEVDAFAPGCPSGDGVHVNEMNVFTWSMDPETGREVAAGEIGENVVTGYANSAQPLLNYRSHDLVRGVDRCTCGRTWRKLPGVVLGRTDFMVTVRGTNVYQSGGREHARRARRRLAVLRARADARRRQRSHDDAFEPERDRRTPRRWPALGRAISDRIHRRCTCASSATPMNPGSAAPLRAQDQTHDRPAAEGIPPRARPLNTDSRRRCRA